VTVSAPGFDFLLRIIVHHKIEVRLDREHAAARTPDMKRGRSGADGSSITGKILTQAKCDINPHLTFPAAFLCDARSGMVRCGTLSQSAASVRPAKRLGDYRGLFILNCCGGRSTHSVATLICSGVCSTGSLS
jgi:hypothetical protein